MLIKKQRSLRTTHWALGEMEASLGLDYFKARTTMRNSLGDATFTCCRFGRPPRVDEGEAVEPAAAMATEMLFCGGGHGRTVAAPSFLWPPRPPACVRFSQSQRSPGERAAGGRRGCVTGHWCDGGEPEKNRAAGEPGGGQVGTAWSGGRSGRGRGGSRAWAPLPALRGTGPDLVTSPPLVRAPPPRAAESHQPCERRGAPLGTNQDKRLDATRARGAAA